MSSDGPSKETLSIRPAFDPRELGGQYQRELTEPPPDRIGPYKILETLGEGGMGFVYLAEQEKPVHRRVALKILKLGMDSKQILARFETEREALALMNHPNVAKVFDGGTTEQGQSYFVMEYVPGIAITEYCDRRRLTTEERLRLFIDVCHAVQHAHQKGIIHRDIKPANVLVSDVDGRSLPKVIDFGIAKAMQQRLSDMTVSTEEGQFIGTPAYVSPEQAGGSPHDIDIRTDVYSLGALLYELLVGMRPFDDQMLRSAPLSEIQRIIREVDPPKPSTRLSSIGALSTTIAQNRGTQLRTLARQVRGDLDWIVMKCLEKDRTRRYPSATELAAEVQRFLSHQPVVAGPPSTAYRVKKFVRRNKVVVAGVTAVVVTLATGLIISDLQRRRAVRAETLAGLRLTETETARDEAETARDEAESVTQFLTDTLAAVDPEKEGKDVTVREVLDRAGEQIGEKFADKPLIEARLRHTVGSTYRALGLYDKAEAHLADAAVLYRRLKGERDRLTLGAVHSLALATADRGEYSAAEAHHAATLEILRRDFGDEHPATVRSMSALAIALNDQGKYAEAERLHRQTLELQRRVLGEEHPETLTSKGNFAITLHDQGKHAEAESLYRQVLEIKRRVLGEEHPETLLWMNNLGTVLDDQGKYADAESLYRQVLEIKRRVLGKEHPATLKSVNNLASARYAQGYYVEAESLYRQTLEIHRRVLGEEHPDTLASMGNLAAALRRLGKYTEAESLDRRTLEIRRRVLGKEHPHTVASMGNLAITLVYQDQYVEAESLHRQTLEIRHRVLGLEHPHTVASMHALAFVLSERGKYAEAESLYRQVLEIQRRVLGEEHPDTIDAMEGLAEALHADGNARESEALYREAIERRRTRAEQKGASAADLHAYASLLLTCEADKLRDPQAGLLTAERAVEMTVGKNYGVLATLALAYQGNGDIEHAVETQRKALGLFPAQESPTRTDLEGKLGEYLVEQANFDEAEPLLLRAHESITRREQVPPDAVKEAVERLVKLYESWDAAEPGKVYAPKAAEWRARQETGNKKLETGNEAESQNAETPK